jgi:hypothetical protein
MLQLKEDLICEELNKRSTETRGQKAKPEEEFTVKLNPSLAMDCLQKFGFHVAGSKFSFFCIFFIKILSGFQNPYKEMYLSEYIKSLIIQLIKKAGLLQL